MTLHPIRGTVHRLPQGPVSDGGLALGVIFATTHLHNPQLNPSTREAMTGFGCMCIADPRREDPFFQPFVVGATPQSTVESEQAQSNDRFRLDVHCRPSSKKIHSVNLSWVGRHAAVRLVTQETGVACKRPQPKQADAKICTSSNSRPKMVNPSAINSSTNPRQT